MLSSEPSRVMQHPILPGLPEFANELLLQQAIARLLGMMPNIEGVQILQGTLELGKDIVFRTMGPLNEILTCACIVKNKPFSGKLGTTGSLRVLIDQIEQAFDTPFLDESVEDRMVHRVYVMNPHQVTPAALAAVEGKLKQRPGQVCFVTGSKLYDLFCKHWPDFLAAESSILAQFRQDLEQASGSVTSLISVAFDHHLGDAGEAENHVYVPPCFRRYINLYSLPENVERVLSRGKIESPWRKSDWEYLQRDVNQLLALVSHLCAWPFPGLVDKPNVQEVTAAHRKLLARVEKALVNAFCKRAGVATAKLRQFPKDAEWDLSTADKAAVTAMADKAEQQIKDCFIEVRSVLAQMKSAANAMPRESDDLLSDAAFIRFCAIDDCLRASQSTILTVVSRKVFSFSKGVHQRHPCSVLIVGGPGTGKTSFCTRNALEDAEHCADDASTSLPVYVPLHKLPASEATTFEDMFLSTAGQSALLPQESHGCNRSALRVYLDGLDEVADVSQRAHILEVARAGPSHGRTCQVILTARDYLYDPLLTWLPRITLRGLDDDEVRALASQWLDHDCEATQDFMNQLKGVPCIKRLVRVPLLATVTILVYKRTKRLPENRARLYTVFVNLLCGGWDLAKGVVRPSRFTITAKSLVLSFLASEMHRDRQRDFSAARFCNVGDRILSRRSPAEVNDLLTEVLRDGLIARTADRYHFTHLTFQEFLTAKEMLGDPQGSKMDWLLNKYYEGDDWWREVLFFSIGLSENPERVAMWLTRHIKTGTGRGKLVRQIFAETFPDFDLEYFEHASSK
ncbi:MAG: hypothetical protein M1133_08045 [Armatimonadetes bacterium]|nr:hypothetical protein [Armatimonadota bacterium]